VDLGYLGDLRPPVARTVSDDGPDGEAWGASGESNAAGATGPSACGAERGGPLHPCPCDLARREATVARWLALAVMILLSAVVLLNLIMSCVVPGHQVVAATQTLLPLLTALAGMVFGYYFSGKRG